MAEEEFKIQPAGEGGIESEDQKHVPYHTHDGLNSPRIPYYILMMTTTERNAMVTPSKGLIIYNTTTNKLNFYTGSAWEAVTSA